MILTLLEWVAQREGIEQRTLTSLLLGTEHMKLLRDLFFSLVLVVISAPWVCGGLREGMIYWAKRARLSVHLCQESLKFGKSHSAKHWG